VKVRRSKTDVLPLWAAVEVGLSAIRCSITPRWSRWCGKAWVAMVSVVVVVVVVVVAAAAAAAPPPPPAPAAAAVEIFIHGIVKATVTNVPQSQLNK